MENMFNNIHNTVFATLIMKHIYYDRDKGKNNMTTIFKLLTFRISTGRIILL